MTSSDPNRSSSSETDSHGDLHGVGSAEPIDPKSRIRHKLIQVRREAEAARLEANAARLEASAEQLEEMLERVDAGHSLSIEELSKLDLPDSTPRLQPTAAKSNGSDTPCESPTGAPEKAAEAPVKAAEAITPDPTTPEPQETDRLFESWDEIRRARQKSTSGANASTEESTSVIDEADQPAADEPTAISRMDGPHASIRAPRAAPRAARSLESPIENEPSVEPKSHLETDSPIDFGEDQQTPDDEDQAAPIVQAIATPIDLESELESDADRSGPRRKPMAVVVSGMIHLILFFILAGFTLTTTMPKDQVALSASVSESSESAIETFQIEAVEPMLEPTEDTPDETQYDVSEFGEMATVDVTSEVIASINQPPAASALTQPILNDSAKLESLKSDSDSKMEFCGVEGGGNHFVYLVDSSGSMGDAFISARRALLESIDLLDPKQRFYVIFFDAKCDYMRIERADQDEPSSVYATPENKQRLKSWAMRVAMDRGKAPYEPLEYALQKLKPDVIFLLSDGEFPQGIEDLLSETNRVSNLFGDVSPISIIHTISYHSREGEARMKRIAEKNYGQYRHVPKPASR